MVRCQEIIWMVRWGVQLLVLAEAGKELEVVEKCETGRKGKEETDCGP